MVRASIQPARTDDDNDNTETAPTVRRKRRPPAPRPPRVIRSLLAINAEGKPYAILTSDDGNKIIDAMTENPSAVPVVITIV